MSNIPSDLKYTKSHEWVRVSGNTATVGITDHAQHELTDIVFVELPDVGRKVKAGEACAVVESVKTASDIYSPVSGEILEANRLVVDDPALVNSEPHDSGWFYKIKLSQSRRTERAAFAGGLQEADWRVALMKPIRLPILLCHANCPRRHLPTEFKKFETSGFVGDFSTYVGTRTGTFYLLYLEKVHYQKIPLKEFLSPALEREGKLLKVPDEINCKLCGNVLNPVSSIHTDGEDVVDAFEL